MPEFSIESGSRFDVVAFLSMVERKADGCQAKEAGGREPRGDVLQGTLDMLVLRALQLEPMHGWAITERIGQWSEQVLQLGQGTLYPALYRLERQGFVDSEWGKTENNRRARYYSLTTTGRKRLEHELEHWQRMSRAIARVLEATAT